MADAKTSIFNKRATEKLRSPDDLDKYVRVTSPSVWVILAACIILIVGLLAWGLFGAVTTNVQATGVVFDAFGSSGQNLDATYLEIILYTQSENYICRVDVEQGWYTYSIGFDNFILNVKDSTEKFSKDVAEI